MKGQQPREMRISVNMKDVKEFLCPKCKGNLFEKLYRIITISKLLPGNTLGKDFQKSIVVFKCANKKCGHVLKGTTPV